MAKQLTTNQMVKIFASVIEGNDPQPSERQTYTRKIAPGQFEFGVVKYSKNFRKRPDIYRPHGMRPSVAEAEAARAEIEAA